MTRLIILLLFLSHQTAFAEGTVFRVLGVRGQVLLEQQAPSLSGSLGQVSHAILEGALTRGLLGHYRGSDAGVLSINGLGSALEVLSDTAMNAYGWCYRVDGQVSELLADQYELTGQETQVEWFYAYAHLDRDQWTSMCAPADHVPVQE